MPVIIKELVIRATVIDSQGKEENSSSSAPPMSNEEKETLVTACVLAGT
jgi:hypothetical protein